MLEAHESRQTGSLQRLEKEGMQSGQKECSPADTLQTSDLQNCVIINLFVLSYEVCDKLLQQQ